MSSRPTRGAKMSWVPTEAERARPGPGAFLAQPWPLWRPLWARGDRLDGWLFHLGSLALMHLISGGGYMLVSRISAARGVTVWDPVLPLDRAVPALGWTIFPYVSYYLYGVLTILVTPRTPVGRQRLLVLYQGLVAMSLVVFAFFLLLPSEIHLVRDLPSELLEGVGLVPGLFRWLHWLDRPWNAWPSHHACVSLVIALFVSRSVASPLARAVMWVAWALLALSILTTKQHFVFDLVTGVALGWATWRLVVCIPLEAADGHPYPPGSEPAPPLQGG